MKRWSLSFLHSLVVILIASASLFMYPGAAVHAQDAAGTFTVASPAAGAGTGGCGGDWAAQMFCSQSLPQMINFAFQAAIRLGAILAVLRIAYAGYLYMGSEDMWSSKTHAKEVFRDAVIGLLVLLGIWLILNVIDPRILNLQISYPKLPDLTPCAASRCPPGTFF